MVGLGVVPCFLGSSEKPPRRRWARLPGEGGLRPCARPLGLLRPLSCPVPYVRRFGASVSALSRVMLLDFLPPLPKRRERAGALCPPTLEGRVLSRGVLPRAL